MSLLLVVVGRGEVLHDEAGAALAEHRLPPLADDVISAAQLVLQEDPHALAHTVAVPLGHRATDDLVLLDGEAAHLEVRLLDGIPLVLAVVVAAVDHAGHGVPADAHLALHLAGVLLHQQAQQAEQAVVGGAGGMVPAPPIQGVVTERPSYVSLIEWMALKSAAQQHADPDAELTRLVNFLRFMRLRDVLDALPQDAAAQRQLLANALLSELPTHVQQGNIGRTEALGLQAQWLAIVQPDEQLRAEMVRQEAARLNPGQ